MRPDILIDQNVPQLKEFVREGVEQAVRSGVNLNHIISYLNGLESAPPPTDKAPKQSIKELMNIINGSKTLLDDSDEEESAEDNLPVKRGGGELTARPIPELESRSVSDLTIDNDDLAPDNLTITIEEDKSKSEDKDEEDEEEDEEDEEDEDDEDDEDEEDEGGLNEEDEDEEGEESEATEKFSVKASDRGSGSSIFNVTLVGDDATDTVSQYTVTTLKPPTKKPITNDTFDMSEFIAGKVSPKSAHDDNSNSATSDTVSTYSVTLLSHNDMLSSRLSRLGAKYK
jgi:hypothetical protein